MIVLLFLLLVEFLSWIGMFNSKIEHVNLRVSQSEVSSTQQRRHEWQNMGRMTHEKERGEQAACSQHEKIVHRWSKQMQN